MEVVELAAVILLAEILDEECWVAVGLLSASVSQKGVETVRRTPSELAHLCSAIPLRNRSSENNFELHY